MQRTSTGRWLLPGAFLALCLLLALGGRPAAAGPVPEGLSAADWAAIRAQLPAAAASVQSGYLKASNVEANDWFGLEVDVDGDTVVVGAYQEDSNGTGENDNSATDAGAAYVFVRSGGGWSQQAYLKASNVDAGDLFGRSVAVDGDTIIVGAPYEASNGTGAGNNSLPLAGAAYVFVRSGSSWSQQAYLKASNVGFFDSFGIAVDVDGDTAVVGAHYERSNGTGQNNDDIFGAGAAYVFVRGGVSWSQQAYLKASNPGGSDLFGYSVGVDGDTVVIGAFQEDGNGTGENDNSATDAGAAYIFARSGVSWSQQAYLKASNVETNDWFGVSVAVDGDTAVVGAYGEDGNGTSESNNDFSGAGAAYVFVRSGVNWSQQAYLKASDPAAGEFGYSVAIDGDTAVVGAPVETGDTTCGVSGVSRAGAAYVFVGGGGWSQQDYLKASNEGSDDSFGYSVAVAGSTVVIGAFREDSNGTSQSDNDTTNAGAVYAFDIAPDTGTIIIQKEATPEDDTAFDFTENIPGCDSGFSLTDPSDNTETFSDVPTGGYTVTETGETGWTLDDVTCDDANSSGDSGTGTATINLEAGETVTCTFTNSLNTGGDTGTIIIQKQATPEGDTEFSFTEDIPGSGSGFTLTDPADNTETFSDVPSGGYTVSETAKVGWTLDSIGCDDPDAGSNTDGATATIDLDAGETVTCTFNNSRDTGTVVIVKAADPADNTPFNFTENLPGAGSGFTLTDPADNTETFSNVPSGGYTVTETAKVGWTLDDITCDDANSSGDTGTSTATINVEKDETVTCTFGNSRDTGTVVIVKAADPADNTPFNFTENLPGAGSGFTLTDPADNTETFSGVPSGGYSVSEDAAPGWTLDSVTCDDANSTGNSGTRTATINVEKDETVTCTFSNSAVPVSTGGVFVSAVSSGMTGDGLSFGPHDILQWSGGAWSKWFDGSAAGLMPKGQNVHNVMAFWIPDPAQPDVVMTFSQNRRQVPGLPGYVDGMDIVRWNGSAFTLWFDGQDVGLADLTKEKIDALHVLDGSLAPPALIAAAGGSCLDYLLISTQAAGQVSKYNGGALKFSGEDMLGFCLTQSGAVTKGKWIMVLDGSTQGMPKDSLTGLSASADGQTIYLTTRAKFNVDDATGGHSMVYRYDFASGEFSGPYFSAPAEGLPPRVAGLQVEGTP